MYHRHEPAREAEYGDLELQDRVATAFDAAGIDRPYLHQTASIESIRDGRNLVVATPTASGKSLIYTIPAVEAVLEAGRRTLYVAPMRALINDQEDTLEDFASNLGFGPRLTVDQYTGQQDQHEKRRIREETPHLLLTTPDMLHMGILPHAHRLWEAFFEEPAERAIVNPQNEELLPAHVRCAARENWLNTGDERYFGEDFPEVVADLEAQGALDRRDTRHGIRWTNDEDANPQLSVNLRTIEDREIRLVDRATDETIARLQFSDALRDAHPGAIHYRQGRTYEVADLQLDRGRALLQETNATYYTKALREKDIAVERELAETVVESHSDLRVTHAEATIRERIDSYVCYHGPDDDGEQVELPVALPETTLRTQTLFFPIPEPAAETIRSASDDEAGFLGALHAVEHGMISLFPLELLCDRRDIGGLSTNLHPYTGQGTIFVHDGHPGGVGLARGRFEAVESLLEETRAMIVACSCDSGCPSCIQSPHCGNANTTLDKELAIELLEQLES